MGKNTVIILLLVFCTGCLVFSIYQKTIAEKALSEAYEQQAKLKEAIDFAHLAEKEALEQREIAKLALQEAYNQKKVAEEALAKCK